jgi:hypothetical protein
MPYVADVYEKSRGSLREAPVFARLVHDCLNEAENIPLQVLWERRKEIES